MQQNGEAGGANVDGAGGNGSGAAPVDDDLPAMAAGGASAEGGAGASVGGAGSGMQGGGAGGSNPDASAGADTYEIVDCPETFENPIIWADLPDLEVIRVGDAYYYTASTFHHSPGAPVLRSYDLVNWEHIGHSVPVLDFHSSYDLEGGVSYRNGIWASTLRYRESNETFYWMGCMHNVGGGYVFTASEPQGPWQKHESDSCYYDMGLLIDDDDKLYVAWGNGTISVAELSADGFNQVRAQEVYETPGNLSGPLEGARFYQINGDYYILLTQYANGEYVLRSTDGPFGPYEMRPFAVGLPSAAAGAGVSPHQGGIIQTANGDWYYMAFNDSYPAGRLPVMAPVTWNDGWPEVILVDGAWGASYPFPDVTCRRVPPRPNFDTFTQPQLSPEWEWNHNPDNSKWSAGDGLSLETASLTNDFYRARNTLTRRIEGPISVATIELDYSGMRDGDVAGLAALRDLTAFIAVTRANGSSRVVVRENVELSIDDWSTTMQGAEVASESVDDGLIWLRVEANVRTDAGGGTARFSYSTDGSEFTPLGGTFNMRRSWEYFLGYRFGIFNYATLELGGAVKVNAFAIDKP